MHSYFFHTYLESAQIFEQATGKARITIATTYVAGQNHGYYTFLLKNLYALPAQPLYNIRVIYGLSWM